MSLHWKLKFHDAHAVESIERHSKVSPIIAQLLAARGIRSLEEVTSFFDLRMTGLRPPEELPGVPEAVSLILEAIASNQKIVVYGDYDADGMTATAILYRCLKLLGAQTSYFVPSRLTDGYGLNCEALEKLKRRGAELIITVDCGIASLREVEFAQTLDLPIIVTDHHHAGPQLPAAAAIVHPGLRSAPYPFPGLCGAGVAFKLAWGLCTASHGSSKLPTSMRNYLFSAVSLAAIGTVCDVVPMKDENRILVHHGLNCMRQFANPGLRELMALAKCLEREKLDTEDIGFSIGPRLNAAGRLGQAQLGVELLVTDDRDRAQELASYLDQLNKNRKSLEIKIQRSAKKWIDENFDPERDAALVLSHDDWHLGVIGIVAGRLAESYQRPTVLISTDPLGARAGVGSCRSACGVNLYEALGGCHDHLEKFGGHAGAAGVTIQPDQIDAFREEFCQQVIQQVNPEQHQRELDVDAEALIGHLTMNLMKELEKLAPFGEENPRPVLSVCGAQAQDVRTMGADETHLCLQIEQDGNTIRAVGFGKAEWKEALTSDAERYDFAFRPVINSFGGRRSVEVQLIDFRQTATEPVGATLE